ncbi:hypothetical protein WI58_34890 [Burkholderia cepacia]|uniref:zf-HC2 domain-containing protein n=1 Tax=Burkholderia cepacia TaxID=292 RepID=UPI000752CB13|nr:zf-HC2 domain-containing protein [Burkholderia cepacia]KVA47881.1 hypothetical protein WI47_20320 [Burkholderia cepacia]KVA57240.1 hypothetical protein WI48_01750 [Burkholderia cepacia]KVA70643.1 hypothetical protein WI49_05520 [Burkholderia cepacia]KVA77484.1 hypothetical protein WI50_33685 [Burkholderia cepacia]KVA87296.1 hypothetical protein WI51_16130 [Burkholderia cepacia]
MSNPDGGERAHLDVWELLPWIVNGRASDAERVLVEAHVRDCHRCRAELGAQRKLHDAMGAREYAGPDLELGLARLWQRFEEGDQGAARSGTPAPARGRMTALACAVAALVLLEAGALVTLGIDRPADRSSASYRTLSDTESGAPRATIRLVADSAMTVGRLQALLLPLHLQIVGGPSESGVYSLGPVVAPGDVAKQLAVLRAAPGVRFAEPVDEGSGGP